MRTAYNDIQATMHGESLPPEFFPREVLEDDPYFASLGDLDAQDLQVGIRNVSAVRVVAEDAIHRRDHRENMAQEARAKGMGYYKPPKGFSLKDVQGAEFIQRPAFIEETMEDPDQESI